MQFGERKLFLLGYMVCKCPVYKWAYVDFSKRNQPDYRPVCRARHLREKELEP